MPDGQVVFEISADGSKAMASIDDITRAIKAAGQDWDKATAASSDQMQKSFNKAFNIERVKNWAIQGTKYVLDFAKGAIEAASNLEEVQNVVDVTFGSGAGEINAWAQTAIKQFGLTETKAKQFASTMGAMMKSSGLAGDEIVGMSKDLAGLAADMSSFYNMDFDTAFQKIRSGISGETEPLKQLGINMSVANLEAFALKQGIEKTFNSMTQGEQVMLRYQYLMQATADAQGDFARTSDGYANAQRLLESNIDSIKTKLGALLVGPLADLTTWANDTLGQLTNTESSTVLDKFAETDLETEKKLAELQQISNQASDLIGVLDSISGAKIESGTLGSGIEELTESLGGLGGALGEAKASDYAGTLGLLAGGANKLNGSAGSRWKGLIESFDGAAGFESAVQAAGQNNYAGTISGLADALSSTTGFDKDKWETLLSTIGDKLPPANSAADKESVSKFLHNAAEAAGELGGDYPAMWQSLIDTLGSDKALALITALAGGDKAGTYLGLIAESANKLDANSKDHWSGVLGAIQSATGSAFGSDVAAAQEKIDALAEALSGGSLEEGKAAAFTNLITTLKENAGSLTELAGTDEAGVEEFLSGLADAANKIDPKDADAWDTLLTALATGLSGGIGSEAGNAYYSALSQSFLAMGSGSEIARRGLLALGYTEDEIANAQKRWLLTCQDLVRTIPGLADIVNTETGEVQGGTDALKQYVSEWKAEQEKLIRWKAYYAKRDALMNAEGGLASYENEATRARQAVRRIQQELADLGVEGNRLPTLLQYENDPVASALLNSYGEAAAAIKEALDEYRAALKDVKTAEEELAKQHDAVREAEQDLADEHDGLVYETGEVEEATLKAADGVGEFSDAVKEAAATSVDALHEALTEMQSYADSVKQSIQSTTSSIIRGFDAIETPQQKARREMASLKDEIEKAKAAGKEYADLQKTLDSKQGEFLSLGQMGKGLESQLEYMREYRNLMEQARARGVSEDILSMLADGSQESYDYLQMLATGAASGKYSIEEINKLYADVQKESEMFTTTLTEQKLSTDEVFDSLVQKANEAVAGVDLGDETKQAAINTMQGLLAGLTELEPSVAAKVAEILAMMNSLSSFGLGTSGLGFTYNPNLTSHRGSVEKPNSIMHSHATGLDYVPFDGYLSILHEGEGVLTAEENRLWRNFKYGQQTGKNSLDYGALSGAIWDNAPNMGGNVYLDGQKVGNLISQQQANSYRSLERSGWRG